MQWHGQHQPAPVAGGHPRAGEALHRQRTPEGVALRFVQTDGKFQFASQRG